MPFLKRFCTVLIPFYMHFVSFAHVPPDEPQGETDCCGLSVYSVEVQIDVSRL